VAGKLFLTGGSGMVGRNVRDHPAAADWEILAPSSRELDLTDPAAVADWLARTRPDLVVHAAGKVGGIGANMAEPVAFLDRNVTIGRNVIMGARAAGVRRLINLGTTCMYPRAAANPLREDALLTGELEPTNEGYALAKIVALRLCDYIRREDARFLYKTLVPCNLYGPHDTFDVERAHLVPAIIAKVHEAMTAGHPSVEIWGDGTARREFMYAGDLADAVFRAARDLEALPGHMNVGAGEDRSIAEYYAIVARVIGWEGRFTHDPDRPAGMARKLCDITRQTDWGWRPRTTLEEGIAMTYRHFLQKVAA
jgi:GDP-L-fucose synthase